MNYSQFYAKRYSQVFVRKGAERYPAFDRLREMLSDIPVHIIENREEIPPEKRNKHSLYLSEARGMLLGRCPGSQGHLCCNYLTVELYTGCDLGCSYCIMKDYLNFSPISITVNTGPGIDHLRNIARNNNDRIIRVGTGELGDSLLLDPMFRLSEEYLEAMSDFPNVFFELKTKTHFIDHLLDLEKKGNAVIAFSLNPPATAQEEEGSASAVGKRIEAARRAVAAGYYTAFHFDPVIRHDNWQEHYAELISALEGFPGSVVRWISIGTLRYTPALKERMEDRPYLYDEFVPCADAKFRYIQKERIAVYRFIVSALQEVSDAPIYFCMESPAVWRAVFGDIPGKLTQLRDIFTHVQGLPDTIGRLSS